MVVEVTGVVVNVDAILFIASGVGTKLLSIIVCVGMLDATVVFNGVFIQTGNVDERVLTKSCFVFGAVT